MKCSFPFTSKNLNEPYHFIFWKGCLSQIFFLVHSWISHPIHCKPFLHCWSVFDINVEGDYKLKFPFKRYVIARFENFVISEYFQSITSFTRLHYLNFLQTLPSAPASTNSLIIFHNVHKISHFIFTLSKLILAIR